MTPNTTPDRQTPVFTLGHSNHTLEDFKDILTAASVSSIYDVRRYPNSKYNPQFNGVELRRSLEDFGIGYVHVPEFGGYRDTPVADASPNGGWKQPFFRNYADYALSPDFQNAFRKFCTRLRPNAAIMCAERDWRNCHRQILADYLILHGFQVFHLIDRTNVEAATLTPFGRAVDGNVIHYPPKPDDQMGFDF